MLMFPRVLPGYPEDQAPHESFPEYKAPEEKWEISSDPFNDDSGHTSSIVDTPWLKSMDISHLTTGPQGRLLLGHTKPTHRSPSIWAHESQQHAALSWKWLYYGPLSA